MKKFEEIDKTLQNQIIDICNEDPYGLNSEFLYMNIFNSTGNTQTLSKVFEVAYNGVFEQCFQKYLNTFCKNIF